MFKAFILAAALTFLMCGCATTPRPETSNLSQITNPRVITLPETISWTKKSTSWTTLDVEYGLLAGTYTATLENNLGTFFYGVERSAFMCPKDKKCLLLIGGAWVPKTKDKSVHLFFVYEVAPPPSVNSIADLKPIMRLPIQPAQDLNEVHDTIVQRSIEDSIAKKVSPKTLKANAVGTSIGLQIALALAGEDEGLQIIEPYSIQDQKIIDLFSAQKLNELQDTSH